MRKISDLDVSSKGGFLRSVRNGSSNKNPPSIAPPIPGALGPPKSDYGPPPVRRAPSSTSLSSSRATLNPSPPASVRSVSGGVRKIPPVPKAIHGEPEEMEEEEQGEWADVLYDYNSGVSAFHPHVEGRHSACSFQEATDLAVEAGDRILVVERSSEDWWKGELNGKTGLFPSSYVRLL